MKENKGGKFFIKAIWKTFNNGKVYSPVHPDVYTWIFENRVSKKINSFYYLATSNDKTSFKGRLKAFIWRRAVS